MLRADVTGKVAIVTGGAAGIGWATARLLAERGARVLLADLDGARAVERAQSLGTEHAAVGVDISVPASVTSMFAACRDAFGKIDILVNNAGRTDQRGLPLLEHDCASFEALLAINLAGTAEAGRQALQAMAKSGGAIVNVASGAAVRALPLRGSYSASKAGVLGLTRALAGQQQVRVNCVAPGFVHTELVAALIQAGRLDPADAAAKIPLGRRRSRKLSASSPVRPLRMSMGRRLSWTAALTHSAAANRRRRPKPPLSMLARAEPSS
ncbi:MAG TPA: SDR family NAD(P)-dependent oxidoreductase [Rhizobiaceae bacterium]|nr:SDR family NAD(P)-dependent oxidoreductase [Rhizobiaceae bacterium]